MNAQRKTKRVLPADVYDTIEFTAHRYGGIGAGLYRAASGGPGYCVIGQAYDAETSSDSSLSNALRATGITEGTNDRAVRAIHRRLGHPCINARVPFEEWAKELGVERGDA